MEHLIHEIAHHIPHLIEEAMHIFSLLHECHIVTPGHHNHILESLKVAIKLIPVFV